MAQHHATGPIPLAAAHAASGLRLLPGVIAASQDAVAQSDVDPLAAQAEHLEAAREALETAIGNTDILLNMLKSVCL
jgi:tetrahydromethanopterin S-methyltransferase subunit B